MLSLPPWQRYKINNVLVSLLFPDGLSAAAQKKFFDKIIESDFNPLFSQGITGPDGENIKVEIFGQVSFLIVIVKCVCCFALLSYHHTHNRHWI